MRTVARTMTMLFAPAILVCAVGTSPTRSTGNAAVPSALQCAGVNIDSLATAGVNAAQLAELRTSLASSGVTTLCDTATSSQRRSLSDISQSAAQWTSAIQRQRLARADWQQNLPADVQRATKRAESAAAAGLPASWGAKYYSNRDLRSAATALREHTRSNRLSRPVSARAARTVLQAQQSADVQRWESRRQTLRASLASIAAD